MDYVGIIIPFVGGLGMFIYGMQIMAQGLENAAGSRMKTLLEALTRNKLMGVLLGALIDVYKRQYIDCAGSPYPDIHGAVIVQSGAQSIGGRKSRYKNFLRKSY